MLNALNHFQSPSTDKENLASESEAKKMKPECEDAVVTPGKQRNRANPTTRWTNDEVERLLEYIRDNSGSFEVFSD